MNKEKIEELEKYYIDEKSKAKEGFELVKKKSDIMLSAPHAIRQFRNDKIKAAEFRTGPMVKILGEDLGLSYITRTGYRNDDPNFDEINPYRTAIKDYYKENPFKLLLDFHIASSDRDFDIDLGTGDGANLCSRLDLGDFVLNFLNKRGIDAKLNHVFSASSHHTVSGDISSFLKVPAIQMEFNWGLIEDSENCLRIIEILKDMILNLEEIL
ncbi:hypothetical protein LV469_07120 [Peptoniphilus sp. GNH]|nr:hypothetical protein LV469_07120 [Peptoniphilus sp. GNH]